MSYIGINLESMTLLFKVADMQSAAILSALEHEQTAHAIFPIERQGVDIKGKGRPVRIPNFLTSMELRLLYKNLTGNDWTSHNIGQLMDALHEAMVALPEDQRSRFHLETKAGPTALPADIGLPERKPFIMPPSTPPSAPVMPSTPSAPGIPSAPRIPSAPTLPRAPSIPKAPPSPTGATGKVWAIADSILAKSQIDPPNMKELRTLVIGECTAQGINPGTAATQYGKWKASKGL